jgi:hypothetical protein
LRLKPRFKPKELCSMEKPRVFVCFKNIDLDSMNKLLEWDKDKEFDFIFEETLPKAAFHSEEAKQIKADLKDKIMTASHFLCLIGKESGDNDWINWEVQTASVNGRKVIAARLDGKYKAPAVLLTFGATWASSFTFEAIKKAIAAGKPTSMEVERRVVTNNEL